MECCHQFLRTACLVLLFTTARSLLPSARPHSVEKRHRRGPDALSGAQPEAKSERASPKQGDEETDNASSSTMRWEDTDSARRLHVHRPGSALISGALMQALSMDLLEDLLNGLKGDVKQAEAINMTRSDGVHVNTDQKRFGDKRVFLFAENNAPGCEKHDEMGDNECYMAWGETFRIRGGLHAGSPIEKGAKVHAVLRFRALSHLTNDDISKQHPSVTIDCPACGDECRFSVGLKEYTVDPGPCPIEVGFYDYWSREFQLPNNIIVKALDFEQDIRLTMKDPNGEKLFDSATHVKTYSGGTGGGF